MSLSFYGCQQNITLELPKYDPKVAVYCILNPTEYPFMTLNLSKSYYSYGDTTASFQFITTAKVYLTDQTANTIDTLKLDSTNGSFKQWFYRGHHDPIAGHNYVANIYYNGKIINAETIVPLKVKIDSVGYIKLQDPNSLSIDYELHVYFHDIQGEANSYSISSSQFTNYTSDLGFDGKQLEIIENLSDIFGYPPPPAPITFSFQLNNYTTATAKYLNDINTQASSANDPLSQPVVIESNVNGGLGIFGAVTQTEVFVRIK